MKLRGKMTPCEQVGRKIVGRGRCLSQCEKAAARAVHGGVIGGDPTFKPGRRVTVSHKNDCSCYSVLAPGDRIILKNIKYPPSKSSIQYGPGYFQSEVCWTLKFAYKKTIDDCREKSYIQLSSHSSILQ